MGSFRRAFLGYRRGEVEAAVASLEARIGDREARIVELERELSCLSGIVLERDREIGDLHREMREANQRHDQSVQTLQVVTGRLEELHAQARGQATRIRMKALREAVEVSRKAEELAGRLGIDPAGLGSAGEVAPPGADSLPAESNGHMERSAEDLFQGLIEVDVGPLGDFSQLVGFEDAAAKIDATSEISVRKFSEGRATLSVRLDEPVELLRELEERAPFEFKVRRTGMGRVVLDVDDDQSQAA